MSSSLMIIDGGMMFGGFPGGFTGGTGGFPGENQGGGSGSPQ